MSLHNTVVLPNEIWTHIFAFLKPTDEFMPALVCRDFNYILKRKRDRRGASKWTTYINQFCHRESSVKFIYNYFGPETIREMVHVAIVNSNVPAVKDLLNYSGNALSILDSSMYKSAITANSPELYIYLHESKCPIPFNFISLTISFDIDYYVDYEEDNNLIEEVLFKSHDLGQIYIEIMKNGTPEQLGKLYSKTNFATIYTNNPCWVACHTYSRFDIIEYMHCEHGFPLKPAMTLWAAMRKEYGMLVELINLGC